MENLFTKKVPLYYETEESQLVLGDSFKILTKMEPESVDMIFADPPYFLSNDGITCQGGKMVSVECVKHRHAKFGGGFVFCHVMLLIILNPSCSSAIPIEYILCSVPDIQIVPFGFNTFLHNLIHLLLNLCFSSTLVPPSESLSHEPLFTETIFPP